LFYTDHSKDPQSCRERTALYVANAYPDPNNLAVALTAVCGDIPPLPTTTVGG
jgi:hypothetical protein